jgi:glycosyltransferase involved in cell wall biosynthesis
MPQISIGMPVFNGALYLAEALNDLCAQTFTDFELLISDNASTDKTAEISMQFSAMDTRIKYFRQSANIGAILNFQFVLDHASTPYFMWAASDDRWDLEWIESLFFEAVSNQCLAYGAVQTIDEKGTQTYHPANRRHFDFSGSRIFRRFKYFLEPGFLGKANPIYGVAPISKFRAKGIRWVENEGGGGDMIFLYDLLARTKIRHVGTRLLYKRIHSASEGAAQGFQPERRGFLRRAWLFAKEICGSPMIASYLGVSTLAEKGLLVSGYPFCVASNMFYSFRSKILRN